MTPAIARDRLARIDEGDELPFALICMTTQDRLSLAQYIEELRAQLQRYRTMIEAYEARIRGDRE